MLDIFKCFWSCLPQLRAILRYIDHFYVMLVHDVLFLLQYIDCFKIAGASFLSLSTKASQLLFRPPPHIDSLQELTYVPHFQKKTQQEYAGLRQNFYLMWFASIAYDSFASRNDVQDIFWCLLVFCSWLLVDGRPKWKTIKWSDFGTRVMGSWSVALLGVRVEVLIQEYYWFCFRNQEVFLPLRKTKRSGKGVCRAWAWSPQRFSAVGSCVLFCTEDVHSKQAGTTNCLVELRT